jgi:hypothetical protein
MKVYQAINKVQAALAKVGISKNSQAMGYKFRGIDAVYNHLAPLIAEHGLCILPRMLSRQCEERVSAQNKALFYVTVEAEFDLVCSEDGSKHTVKTFGEAMDSGDKATNKAMSSAFKYACFQAFCIPTEADNDTENETHEVKATPQSLLEQFEKTHLQAFRDAAMQGKNAMNEIWKTIPKSELKEDFWKKHGEVLTKAAEMVEVKA